VVSLLMAALDVDDAGSGVISLVVLMSTSDVLRSLVGVTSAVVFVSVSSMLVQSCEGLEGASSSTLGLVASGVATSLPFLTNSTSFPTLKNVFPSATVGSPFRALSVGD